MDYLYIVATKKEVLVTIRIAENVRDEFKKAAELRGSTMSGLMHQFIVRTIREEKQMSPQAFGQPERHLAPVVATITPAVDPKDEVRRMINDEQHEEIERRLRSGKGVSLKPIAPGSKIKTEKTYIQEKRKAR